MNSTLWWIHKSKYLKWTLLLASFVSVYWVDCEAGAERKRRATAENYRDLKMLWDVTSELVSTVGLDALPIQEQEAWDSLDIYVIDATNRRFVTAPRFSPWRERVVKSLAPGYDGAPIECFTKPFDLAVGGEVDVGTFLDYRDVPIISAFGLIEIDGKEHVLLVEMDVDEATAVSPPYYLDEYLTGIFGLIIGSIVFFVHGSLNRILAENTQLIEDAKTQRDDIEAQLLLQRATKVGTSDSVSGRAKILEDAWEADQTDGRAILRQDGTFYFANPMIASMLGVTMTKLKRSTIHEILDWLPDHKKWFDAQFESGDPIPFREVTLKLGGQDAEAILSILFVDHGKDRFGVATIRAKSFKAGQRTIDDSWTDTVDGMTIDGESN